MLACRSTGCAHERRFHLRATSGLRRSTQICVLLAITLMTAVAARSLHALLLVLLALQV
jgi:hypothetical protein